MNVVNFINSKKTFLNGKLHLQGIMVVLFIILDWIFVLMKLANGDLKCFTNQINLTLSPFLRNQSSKRFQTDRNRPMTDDKIIEWQKLFI